MKDRLAGAAWSAWLLTAVYYLYQYVLRSAPAVLLPQLSDAFQLTSVSVASLLGIFYYGYSPFSLVAGATTAIKEVHRSNIINRHLDRSGMALLWRSSSALS